MVKKHGTLVHSLLECMCINRHVYIYIYINKRYVYINICIYPVRSVTWPHFKACRSITWRPLFHCLFVFQTSSSFCKENEIYEKNKAFKQQFWMKAVGSITWPHVINMDKEAARLLTLRWPSYLTKRSWKSSFRNPQQNLLYSVWEPICKKTKKN